MNFKNYKIIKRVMTYQFLTSLDPQVLIFQDFRVFMVLPFGLPIECAPFKVKNVLNVCGIITLDGIAHEYKVDRHYVFHLHSEYTIYPGKDRLWVVPQVVIIVFKHTLEGFKFTLSHSFDDELFIVREEEKAAGFTLRFTSFEDHFTVSVRGEGVYDVFLGNAILFPQNLEDVTSNLIDLYCFIDDDFIVLWLL